MIFLYLTRAILIVMFFSALSYNVRVENISIHKYCIIWYIEYCVFR